MAVEDAVLATAATDDATAAVDAIADVSMPATKVRLALTLFTFAAVTALLSARVTCAVAICAARVLPVVKTDVLMLCAVVLAAIMVVECAAIAVLMDCTDVDVDAALMAALLRAVAMVLVALDRPLANATAAVKFVVN
jgi:hypothetical protein